MWTPTGKFALLGLVVLTAGVAAWFYITPSARLLRCTPVLADNQYYEVSFSLDYATRLDRMFPQQAMFGANKDEGTIAGKFYMEWRRSLPLVQSNEIQVRILNIALNDADDSVESPAGQPAIDLKLRMDESCDLTLSSLPPGADELDELIVRMLSLFTFNVPAQQENTWQAEHVDNIGSYTAEYQLVDRNPDIQVISKKRERYLNVSADNDKLMLTPRIIESASVGRFVPGKPWLHALEGVEDVSLLQSGRAVVQTRVSYSVKQLDDGFEWLASLSEKIAIKNQLTKDANKTLATENVVEPATQPGPHDDSSYAAMLATYMDMITTASISAALDYLVNALQTNPDLAYTLQQQILDESLDRKAAPVAFLALEKSGTQQAYAVLVSLVEDPAASSITHSRAIYALASSRPNSIEVVQILLMQLDRADTSQSMASQSALMALGIMSSKIDNESDPAKILLREIIQNQLLNAGDKQSLQAALGAAFNAADEQMNPLVAKQLESSSPSIRLRAIEVIGKTGAITSREQLVEHYANERDASVRAASLNSLTTLLSSHNANATGEEVEMITSALKTERNADVKASMFRFLGAQPDNNQARAALAQQVRTEKDPALLKQLGQIVSAEDLMLIRRDQ